MNEILIYPERQWDFHGRARKRGFRRIESFWGEIGLTKLLTDSVRVIVMELVGCPLIVIMESAWGGCRLRGFIIIL